MLLDEEQARGLIENSHDAWRRGSLAELLDQYADDMTYWCNAGDPSGGPVELVGKAAFRETLAAVLRTTRCAAHILTFDFDGACARIKAYYRLERIGTGVVLEGRYRQVVFYKRGLISRLEEYHDAGRLTAFWQMTSSEGALPKAAVWDAEPPVTSDTEV